MGTSTYTFFYTTVDRGQDHVDILFFSTTCRDIRLAVLSTTLHRVNHDSVL